ncbi:UNVERIFIED_CONTAM: Thaumatin-like protein 1 [Sesamum radiatum]|uniref:Thaumatin-like protein 1 n=1 Tax=Sesamum radiatum TaxID=300843 RepID=A0AAW2PYA0_SESRA
MLWSLFIGHIYISEQVRLHSLARHFVERWDRTAFDYWIRVADWGLWLRQARMRRGWCCSAGHARGIHAGRRRREGLLRRQPRRRVQPADAGGAAGRVRVNCSNTGCVVDLNGACPSELRVTSSDGEGVACKSACEAFRKDQYCCSGAYGTPDACKPSQYSQVFKSACPHAYSYAYDDRTSTFTCTAADYVITFCPSPNTSQKSSSGGPNPGSETNGRSPLDGNMVYEGALDASAAPSTCAHVLGGAIAIVAAMWRLCHLF